jgi:hypothetical protein
MKEKKEKNRKGRKNRMGIIRNIYWVMSRRRCCKAENYKENREK